jgi:arsenite methyltransferase
VSDVKHADYGYDAPYALAMFAVLTLFSAVGAVWMRAVGAVRPATVMTAYAAFFFANLGSFLYTTRRGKFLEWNAILNALGLNGHERVLDMGCGRGAVLTAIARRLTTGTITGIDIWSTTDQSGNARAVVLRNAELEGVKDRVRIDTGDMRALPYPDASFDLVVSSLAIHNIRGNADRQRAISEAYRVLKPGGRLVVADIRATAVYERALRALGALAIERRRLGWKFWWGNPIAATTLLTASKPRDSAEIGREGGLTN